ncbi:hypothetical protein D3C71_2212630 [compost metagenome]
MIAVTMDMPAAVPIPSLAYCLASLSLAAPASKPTRIVKARQILSGIIYRVEAKFSAD